jgi:hypothetical protein
MEQVHRIRLIVDVEKITGLGDRMLFGGCIDGIAQKSLANANGGLYRYLAAYLRNPSQNIHKHPGIELGRRKSAWHVSGNAAFRARGVLR